MDNKNRFSILTFPQRIEGGTLSFNILMLPQMGPQWNGNPLLDLPLPAGDGTPFAAADLAFEARIVSDLSQFPQHEPVADTVVLQTAATTPDAPAIYGELQNQFQIKENPASTDFAGAPKPNLFIKKYLPRTYRSAFHFTRPSVPEAVTDDSYHCAIKEDKKTNPNFKPSPPEITWGKVYAYCLRHPLLSRRVGLIRSAEIAADAALFANGGYLFVTLSAGSDYVTDPPSDDHFNFIRHYAARIPVLEPGVSRPLFAANLFPVIFPVPGSPPAGSYDQVFIDTADYDDGFGKIVHARQPVSQNLLQEEEDGFAPLLDLGIQNCWDDEKVLQWLNRQLKKDEDTGLQLDAPLGVFAYRVDVRRHTDEDEDEEGWHSLVRVQSKNSLQLGPVNLGTFDGELGVEVHPMQLDGDQENGQFWLPSYFSAWNGRSLVLPDDNASELYKTEQAKDNAAALGRLYNAAGLEDISLRYGETYDFRVRLMDLTSGGPSLADDPVYDAPAPIATQNFKRYVQPESLLVDDLPRLPDQPLDTYFSGDTLTVRRPLLGYPAVVYTGKYPDDDVIPLLQAASTAALGSGSFGIADPDVLQVRVDVEVRSLKMDNMLSLSGQEPFIHLYTTFRDFPAAFDAPLSVPLEFRDANILNFGDPADLGDLGVNVNDLLDLDALVLPRGREIRLTLRGIGDGDPEYYGAESSSTGKPIQLKVRRESTDERDLLADLSPARQIRGIYLQPDPPQPHDGRLETLLFQRGAADTPAMIQRLAQQLDVEHRGLTLVGEKGQRVIFGCSRRIRHTLAPDHSSITFASKDELLNHWIVALTFQVERDWTWDMVEEVSFEIFREKRFHTDNEIDDNQGRPVGDLEMKGTAPINALQNPNRSKTTLIYLDAVEPKSTKAQPGDPQASAFPDTIELSYRVEPRFKTAPALVDDAQTLALDALALPVTTPPAQVPRLASAGLALSPYRREEDYSATEPRERYLWLEFTEPLRDPNNSYFIRLLGYAPDPLLSDNRIETLLTPDEPPIGLDPELIRVITPGQSDDQAGLAAMQLMEPATNSDRHFLVPLPPGLHAESDELFGFFTYELRVGHTEIWSTAQGRFGRPLRTTGVQHPSPALFCTCYRDEVRLLVQAPHAKAVLNGKNITADPPRSEMWALLYAQVKQADGKDTRNILLDDRQLSLIPKQQARLITEDGADLLAQSSGRGTARSSAQWNDGEVKMLLAMFGLPQDASLSVVCAEMMPHFGAFMQTAEPENPAAGDFLANVRLAVGGAGTAAGGTSDAPPNPLRPLSDRLGQFRILRTSPLTPVPDIC